MAHFAANSSQPLRTEQIEALAQTPQAPVVVMLHGFRYCPNDATANPHDHILAPLPQRAHWKIRSWPHALDLTGGDTLGYGWSAQGTIWQAYDAAAAEGAHLARLIRQIRQAVPHRPISVIGHSLGARVALQALHYLEAGDLHRAVLLSPAEFRRPARDAAVSAAGQRTEIFSMLSHHNTAYDLLLRAALPTHGRALGGKGPDLRNWLDVHLDAAPTREGLARMGHGLGPADKRVCHWSAYLRDGVWPFYRDLLTRPGATPLPWLRDTLRPQAAGGWGFSSSSA